MAKKSFAENLAKFSQVFDPIHQIDSEIAYHEGQIKRLQDRRREEINRSDANKKGEGNAGVHSARNE